MTAIDSSRYRINSESTLDLRDRPTREGGGLKKRTGKQAVNELSMRLAELQKLLYAERSRSLLVILQAMDAGGKDSAVRRVFHKLNPARLHVKDFKRPGRRERQHDFLWRIHPHVPGKGEIAVFNRSQYEDVVSVRVRHPQPLEVWRRRFEHINAFERLLADEGTMILKFFLHISKNYQKDRLQKRLQKKEKMWKFDTADLDDRKHWDTFLLAYSEAIQYCSTETAPWYVVPAERRWFRDLVITRVIVDRLQHLQMEYPNAPFDPASIRIP